MTAFIEPKPLIISPEPAHQSESGLHKRMQRIVFVSALVGCFILVVALHFAEML